MAVRRNIFATAFIKAGKALGAFPGWVRDWRRMCYLWEHLDGADGVRVEWLPDGSCRISGRECGGSGGGGGGGVAAWTYSAADSCFLNANVQIAREIVAASGNTSIGDGTWYVVVNHDAKTATVQSTKVDNSDSETCFKVAVIWGGAQTEGIYSMPVVPLYET